MNQTLPSNSADSTAEALDSPASSAGRQRHAWLGAGSPGGLGAIVAALLLGAVPAAAQIPDGFNPSVTGGSVNCFAVQADGRILIGGAFTSVASQTRNGLARMNADGSLDLSFTPSVSGSVDCIAVQSDGKILVGGFFTQVSGVTRNFMARLNPDGSLDTTFNPNIGGPVDCIAIQPDGRILIGGSFDTVGTSTRNKIARLASTGALDSFAPGANDRVHSIVALSDGSFIVAGAFTTIGGQPRSRIARYTAASALDTTFVPEVANTVQAVAVQPDGAILVGGTFTSVGSQTRSRLARLNANGTLDGAFAPGADGAIRSIAVQADGRILVSGTFTSLGGIPRDRVGRLLANGAIDGSFIPNPNQTVNGVFLLPDGRILVGGNFTTIGGVSRNRLARFFNDVSATSELTVQAPTTIRWTREGSVPDVSQVVFERWTGTAWASLGTAARTIGTASWRVTGLSLPPAGFVRVRARAVGGSSNGSSGMVAEEVRYGAGFEADSFLPAVNGWIQAAIPQPDGKVLLAGNFSTVGGVSRSNLARVNPDGSLDAGFNPVVSGGFVNCVAVEPGGSILIGGAFTSVGGQTRNRIARLLPDGRLDTAFNPNADGTVRAIAIQADGKILVGGAFANIGGSPRSRVARLLVSGSADAAFVPPSITGSSPHVSSIAILPDGRVLIGGNFTGLGGATRRYVARLSAAGGFDAGFDANVNSTETNPEANVTLQPDGKVVLWGRLTSVGGQIRNYLARVHPNGGLDADYDPNVGDRVRCAALQADGKLLIGGDFQNVGGRSRSRFAKINPDGSVDLGLSLAANAPVESLAMQADGRILAGGGFTSFGGSTRNYIARIAGPSLDANRAELSVSGAGQIDWVRPGAGPEIGQVVFDRWTGTGWASLGEAARVPATGGWRLGSQSLPASGWVRARGFAAAGLGGGSATLFVQEARHGAGTPRITSPEIYDPGTIGSLVSLSSMAQPDGRIVVGGDFSYLVVPSDPTQIPFLLQNLARFHPDGRLDDSFLPSVDGPVTSVLLQDDGKILIGGHFSVVNGLNRSGVARFNANGSLDTGFNPGVAGTVGALCLLSNGDILVGGSFSQVGGQSATNLARITSSGSRVATFAPNPNAAVHALAVQANGRILVGGSFGSISGGTRARLARLLDNGSLDTGFNAMMPTTSSTSVSAVAVQADGKILVGGNFASFNSVSRPRIARLNESNGGLDGDFNLGLPATAGTFVRSIAVQADGSILFGGEFYEVKATARRRIARVAADGSLDPAFDPAPDGPVHGVELLADGAVVVSGEFARLSGLRRHGFAVLNNDRPASQQLSVSGTSQITWLRSGSAPEFDRVVFERWTGTAWSPVAQANRAAGGWSATGLSLPASGQVRARGRTIGGFGNASSSLVEQSATYVGTPPTLASPTSTSITANSAVVGATVSSSGGSGVTERGIVIAPTSANGSPEVGGSAVSKISASGTTGTYSIVVSALSVGTTYSYRGYASNDGGLSFGYSPVGTFTTVSLPSVSSASFAAVSASGATLSANVTGAGGGTILERGFVVSEAAVNGNPTLGGNGVTKLAVQGATGAFSGAVSGLRPGIRHAFRAFATNAAGTNYTGPLFFNTTSNLALDWQGLGSSGTRTLHGGEWATFSFNLSGRRLVDFSFAGGAGLTAVLQMSNGTEMTVAIPNGRVAAPSGTNLLLLTNPTGGPVSYSLALDAGAVLQAIPRVGVGSSRPWRSPMDGGYGILPATSVSLRSQSLRRVTAFADVGNVGNEAGAMRVRAARGSSLFRATYLGPGGNVTAALVTGTFRSNQIAPSATPLLFTAQVDPQRSALTRSVRGRRAVLRKSFTIPFVSSAVDSPFRSAIARITVWSR